MGQDTAHRSFEEPNELREFPHSPAGTTRGSSETNGSSRWTGSERATTPARSMDPVAVVQAFGAAWANHDLDAAISFLTTDCVFDATGPAPDGARHEGTQEIRQAWRAIFDDSTSMFEDEETFALGDRVVQRWCYRWTGGHVRGVDLFKVRGTQISEKFSYVKG